MNLILQQIPKPKWHVKHIVWADEKIEVQLLSLSCHCHHHVMLQICHITRWWSLVVVVGVTVLVGHHWGIIGTYKINLVVNKIKRGEKKTYLGPNACHLGHWNATGGGGGSDGGGGLVVVAVGGGGGCGHVMLWSCHVTGWWWKWRWWGVMRHCLWHQ